MVNWQIVSKEAKIKQKPEKQTNKIKGVKTKTESRI